MVTEDIDIDRVGHRLDTEEGGHAVEVVGVGAEGDDLRDDVLAGPLDAEEVGQVLEIRARRLADAEHIVAEPRHTKRSELRGGKRERERGADGGEVRTEVRRWRGRIQHYWGLPLSVY